MGLGDYLRSVRRRWWVLLLLIVVVAGAAVVTAPKKSKTKNATQYKATTLLSFIAPSSANRPTVQGLAQAQAILSGGDVPTAVAKQVGFRGDPADLLSQEVTVSTDAVAGSVTINAQDNDPRRAAAIADGLANGLLAAAAARSAEPFKAELASDTKNIASLNAQIAPLQAHYDKDIAASDPRTRPPNFDSALKAQIDGLSKEIQDLTTSAAQLQAKGPDPSGFQILSKASVVPVSTTGLHLLNSTPLRGLLGALLALLIGIGLVILFDRVDGRIRTRTGAEFAFGVPVLAEVPPLPRSQRRRALVLASVQPNSAVAEAYRVLRTSLLQAPTVPRLRSWSPDETEPGPGRPAAVEQAPWHRRAGMTLLVVSPGSREGRTTTVANLAASLTETDRSVVAVDADMRNPALDRFLGLDPSPGLTDAAATGEPLSRVVRHCAVDQLLAITAGSRAANPATAVLAAAAQLAGVHEIADLVVVDAPALLGSNDAISLLPLADAVVLVCRWGKTSTTAAWRTTELLARLGSRVAGVVIVGSPTAPTARVRRRGRKLRSGPVVTPAARSVTGNGHRHVEDPATSKTGGTAPDGADAPAPSRD